MKTLKLPLFMLLVVAFIFTSCSDDDSIVLEPDVVEEPDTTPEPEPDPVSIEVAINEFSSQGDWVEIVNQGTESADISDFWLCLGPGTYQQISALTVLGGDTTIPVGGFLVVEYGLPDTDAGLGLYNSNSDFGDATTIADFVQYGAGGSARENVAVEAGIWTAGEFVTTTVSTTNSIAYDGEGDAASDWAETTTPTPGDVNEVTPPMN